MVERNKQYNTRQFYEQKSPKANVCRERNTKAGDSEQAYKI